MNRKAWVTMIYIVVLCVLVAAIWAHFAEPSNLGALVGGFAIGVSVAAMVIWLRKGGG